MSDGVLVSEADVSWLIELVGKERWNKRLSTLRRSLGPGDPEAKITIDYNWLELIIDDARTTVGRAGLAQRADPGTIASAAYFLSALVRLFGALSGRGRRSLGGRLRAALQTETGMAPVYAEVEIARQIWGTGYELQFPDLEGTGRFDLLFRGTGGSGEVECKALSPDAGRKIHRKDFYRAMRAIAPALEERLDAGVHELYVITLRDRLPKSVAAQRQLRDLLQRFLRHGDVAEEKTDSFRVTREPLFARLKERDFENQTVLHGVLRNLCGRDCHAWGVNSQGAAALVVMLSDREDDTSKPLLEAMRHAARQFTGTMPGFICVQFDDLSSADLVSLPLRQRLALLSYQVFIGDENPSVAAAYFSAYGGLVTPPEGMNTPFVVVPNPSSTTAPSSYPIAAYVDDETFGRILGRPLPSTSISAVPLPKANGK